MQIFSCIYVSLWYTWLYCVKYVTSSQTLASAATLSWVVLNSKNTTYSHQNKLFNTMWKCHKQVLHVYSNSLKQSVFRCFKLNAGTTFCHSTFLYFLSNSYHLINAHFRNYSWYLHHSNILTAITIINLATSTKILFKKI